MPAKKVWSKSERKRMADQVSRGNDRAATTKRKKALAELKKSKRENMRKARQECAADRERTKKRTRAAYQAKVARARAKRDEARAACKDRCSHGKRAVEQTYDPAITRARTDLDQERAFQEESKRIRKQNEERQRSRATSGERLRESEDEIISNLPPELVPVWHATKRVIKGGPRRSRLEAFQEYVAENPGLVQEVQERAAAKALARYEREAATFYAEQARRTGARREEDPDVSDVLGEAIDEVFSFFDDLAGPQSRAA